MRARWVVRSLTIALAADLILHGAVDVSKAVYRSAMDHRYQVNDGPPEQYYSVGPAAYCLPETMRVYVFPPQSTTPLTLAGQIVPRGTCLSGDSGVQYLVAPVNSRWDYKTGTIRVIPGKGTTHESASVR